MRVNHPAPNTTVVETDGARILFSYDTAVAAYVPGRGFLRTNQFYSVTTSRHINKWLGKAQATLVPQEEIDGLLKG